MGANEARLLKVGLAEMLKGGVIMDVTTAEQAQMAERAGAAAVMALERIPADIRAEGGVARMSNPSLIQAIQTAVSIPVMAKSSLGEALRRIGEGAAMIRTKGEAGSGNVVEAVRHLRLLKREIARVYQADRSEWMAIARELGAPYELIRIVAEQGRLPVPMFCAGGISTPADAALVRQLGAEAVFVGSGIFKSEDPEMRAAAIVAATTYFDDPEVLLQVSSGLLSAMRGIDVSSLEPERRLAGRGW
ncbi:MAG: pyridoxal 5'-phosphate synthase lyase subunit PdxS [Gammaproteobacteria bacterium]|nr:pyridoxal 5'-phosphate synthase lyase subunit PdxS [Gammaproteobacteria bacterium]